MFDVVRESVPEELLERYDAFDKILTGEEAQRILQANIEHGSTVEDEELAGLQRQFEETLANCPKKKRSWG